VNEFDYSDISQYNYKYDAIGGVESEEKRGKAINRSINESILGSAWFQDAQAGENIIEATPYYREYLYDNIGNRLNTISWGNNDPYTTAYTTNPLNQYERTETSPGEVNEFEHDDDGNLIGITGQKNVEYKYNAENRLISAQPANPKTGDIKTSYAYDYMGRRVSKATAKWENNEWNPEKEIQFVYDGWNMICEIKKQNNEEETSYYVWGLDLSGSIQGAGGIGGLIARVDDVLAPFLYDIYYYLYNGNGNVSQMIDAQDGSIAAHYDYDPFGNVTYSFGDMAEDNVFRFSTKYHDDETGLVYYGFRYYLAELGRWSRRDPIYENGGINLFIFNGNNTLIYYDPFGREWGNILHDLSQYDIDYGSPIHPIGYSEKNTPLPFFDVESGRVFFDYPLENVGVFGLPGEDIIDYVSILGATKKIGMKIGVKALKKHCAKKCLANTTV
ncbi:MAG: RHS repeat-associated core domain-containing protein, partial [bacterium]|nr:RHS repeat-associated core domain-containing protein [bacterium]